MKTLLLLPFLMLLPASVYAEVGEVAPPEDVQGALDTVRALVEAASTGAWTLALGLFIMLAVFLMRRLHLLTRIPASWTPWVAVAVSLLGHVGASLATGVWDVALIVDTVLTAIVASGLWSTTFKHWLPKEPIENVPDPAA